MSTLNNEILFKKFEVLSCYKKDEHSAVYLANHIYLEKKVFLKILNTETIPDDTIIERFKREAKILAQLEHPNIIKVFDFGMFKKYFYISFEYFESKNLREYLSVNKQTEKIKREIFIQIVKGLDFAHRKNIIHRDIKPDNILINENNEVKLTDFGLAQNSSDNLITQRYSVVGTPAYMSPEQIQGEQLTVKSDLFSLGITAFELFKNTNPFLGKEPNETINNIISFDEENNPEIFSGLSEEIRKVIKDLLVADPEKRLNSCSEILKILNEKNEMVSNETIKRKSFLPYLIILAAIILLGFILYFTLLPNNSEENPPIITKNNLEKPDQNSENKEGTLKPVEKIQTKQFNETTPKENLLKIDNQEKGIVTSVIENEKTDVKLGELYIKCYPWAKVYLDNKYIETTPLSKNIKTKTGKYLLTLKHPNFPEYSDSINISENKLFFAEVNLDTLFGYFNCQVYPWSEIYIDGIKKGITPLEQPIKLEEGKYNLKLVNPQFENIETTIIIKRNDTLFTKFNMQKGKQINVVR